MCRLRTGGKGVVSCKSVAKEIEIKLALILFHFELDFF